MNDKETIQKIALSQFSESYILFLVFVVFRFFLIEHNFAPSIPRVVKHAYLFSAWVAYLASGPKGISYETPCINRIRCILIGYNFRNQWYRIFLMKHRTRIYALFIILVFFFSAVYTLFISAIHFIILFKEELYWENFSSACNVPLS